MCWRQSDEVFSVQASEIQVGDSLRGGSHSVTEISHEWDSNGDGGFTAVVAVTLRDHGGNFSTASFPLTQKVAVGRNPSCPLPRKA